MRLNTDSFDRPLRSRRSLMTVQEMVGPDSLATTIGPPRNAVLAVP